MILKPNMVIARQEMPAAVEPGAGRRRTVRCLRRQCRRPCPASAFLSGGQSPAAATLHLSLMNAAGNLPWQLSVQLGRALQMRPSPRGAGRVPTWRQAQRELRAGRA